MVFESLVTDALNRVLGDFIENLDSKQLNLGIWGGDVELKNLLLKESAIDKLELPLQISYGRLGTLSLRIPWKNLYSSAVCATIDGLYLILVPNKEINYDEKKEEEKLKEVKKKALLHFEERKKKEIELASDDSFVEKLIIQIIKNLEIKIGNIHIRYEDKITKFGHPFSIGITLSNLSVNTTDENWTPTVVQEIVNKIYKAVQLDALSVYWNPDSVTYSHLPAEEIVNNLVKETATNKSQPKNYQYLLLPITSSLKLKLNPKPEKDKPSFTIPKVHVDVEMEKLGISLSKIQFKNVINLIESMEMMSKGVPYRKYRPNVSSYKGHYKEWWHFAYICILQDVRRKRNDWNWEHMKKHRSICKDYEILYKKKMENETMSETENKLLEEYENFLNITNLIILRQKVEVHLERLEKLKPKPKGWISNWWWSGSEKTEEPPDLVKQVQAAMTPEEKRKLYEAIGYHEDMIPAKLPESYIDMSGNFTLKNLVTEVYDLPLKVLACKLAGVNCKFQTRAGGNSVRVTVNVDTFSVNGIKRNQHLPVLIMPMQEDETLLDFTFETNPIDKKCGQRMSVELKPLKITYDTTTIENVIKVFTIPKSSALEKLSSVAATKLNNIKTMSASGLQYYIDSHAFFDIKIDISAPIIVIPNGGEYTGNEDVLAINMGRAIIKSIERPKHISVQQLYASGTSQDEIMKAMIEHSYDKFVMSLTEVQIVLATSNDNWMESFTKEQVTPLHLLNPLSLEIIYSKCLISDDPQLPLSKITGELPSLSVSITDKRLIMLLSVIECLSINTETDLSESKSLTRKSSSTSSLLQYMEKVTVKNTKSEIPSLSSIAVEGSTPELKQFIDLDVNFVMKELSLNLGIDDENTKKSLLDFVINSTKIIFIKRTFNSEVGLRVESMSLVQSSLDKRLVIMNTPLKNEMEHMFSLKFIQVDKRSPEFHTKEQSCEKRLVAEFNALEVLLHQEALLELMNHVSNIQKRLDEKMRKIEQGAAIIAIKNLPQIIAESTENLYYDNKATTTPKKRRKKTVIETIKFKLIAALREVQITLAHKKYDLASLKVSGMTAEIIIKEPYTQIKAQLVDLSILNLTPKALHSKILTVYSDEAINVQTVLYNLEDYDYLSTNMSVNAYFGGLRLVFLNKFVTEILSFLNNFQAAVDVVLKASQNAAQQAKQNVEEAISKAMKMALDINIRAPIIIVPMHSRSTEAFNFDFGLLKLKNSFLWLPEVNENKQQKAVVDELIIILEDLKLERVHYKDDNLIVDHLILGPLTSQLNVNRNLCDWYHKVPNLEIFMTIKYIMLSLSQDDYNLALNILEKNIGEGNQNATQQRAKQLEKKASKNRGVTSGMIIDEKLSEEKKDEVYITLKFTFLMEKFVFTTYSKSNSSKISVLDPSLSLAMFTLEMLSVKGMMYSDESMGVSVMLVNCIIEDTRINRKGFLTRLCEAKTENVPEVSEELASNNETEIVPKCMLDIVYQQKNKDGYLNVHVSSFALIFNVEFILQMLEFVKKEKPDEREILLGDIGVANLASTKQSNYQSIQAADSGSLFTIKIKMEKPDIILVEHLNSIDTNSLILNFELNGSYRSTERNQVINCSMNELQMYTCIFDPTKRDETKANVIFPINISAVGSTPEGEGLHMEVYSSDIRIRVSPVTIDLLNRVNESLLSHTESKKQTANDDEDFSRIWEPKVLENSRYWFLQAELAEEAESYYDLSENETPVKQQQKSEICFFTVDSILVTLEAGVQRETLPMLFLHSKFNGTVKNWSTNLALEASLSIKMGYYNSRLALWEPLIEPVQIVQNQKAIYQPWELNVEVHITPETNSSIASPTSEMEEIDLPPPPMVINVSSTSNLEITVTKTLLQVLQNLSSAFSPGSNQKDVIKSTDPSPYKIINDTDMKVNLLLDKGSFSLFENSNAVEVTLEPGAVAPLELKQHQERDLDVQLNFSDLKKTVDRILMIKIEDSSKELKLPFKRADMRYFPLNDSTNRGIISEVVVNNGVLSLTLRSILKVYNHFTVPVDVYYRMDISNSLTFIFTIKPGKFENLPLAAVYSHTHQLFFSVTNYAITTEPFVWTDLISTISISKKLICPPKSDHKEDFILQVSGKMEQVYYETSTRHTMGSVCYQIILRPSVIFKNCLPMTVVCIVDKLMEEYLIEPGETTQLPNVKPGSSSITLKIPDYMEKEWSCKNLIEQNPSEFTVWQFSSYENVAKINLDLGIHCKEEGGSTVFSLYCPFWLVNRTGITLDYRKSKKEKVDKGSPQQSEDNMNIITSPDDFDGPILFSFSSKNFFGKKKASIRIEDGDWSDKFPLDVAGSSGYVVCKRKEFIYSIGVKNTLSSNGLTKLVTFTPYFVIVNNASCAIECQEFDRPADAWFRVEEKSCSPFWPKSTTDEKLIKLRVAGTSEITPPFVINAANHILLKLDNKYGGIHADVLVTESSTYINLHSFSEGLPPPMIINHTDKAISYWEKETVQIKKLEPNHSVLYTWANPPGCRVLAWDAGNKKEMQDELRTDGLKEYYPMEDYTVYWVSFLNGMQRVILFTLTESIAANVHSAKQFELADKEINVSIHGIGLSLVNNVTKQELMYMAIANSGIIWEFSKLNSHRFLEMSVRDSYLIEQAYQKYMIKEKVNTADFARELIGEKMEVDFQTLMILKPNKRKIRRVFQHGLWIQMRTSPYQLQFHAKINKVQIDNQLFDCIFPIVLAPIPPPRTMGDNFHRPFIEMSVVKRIMKYSRITQFKYFKILIQEFHVKVDVGFIVSLLDLVNTSTITEEEERKQFLEHVKLSREPLKSLVVTISQKEQKSFYDMLHFSPLKIHVSFSLQSGNYKGLSQLDLVNVILQGLGVTLTDMQDVVFKLAYFERNYTFLSESQLISEVTSHYSNQAIKQLYVLVLGLDVLGNPYGLVLGITKGFEDFFYEPIQGAIQGPGEFAEGLVLGARSLFSHTVGGAAGAVSRITGAMGKGIAALTFDEDYQRRRRDAMSKKPSSVQEGLARGGKGLVMGVFDGVTGVFTKPISGAKNEGVEGFFKGLGKGAIGLVTRPTAGVIDFASGSLEAVKRATDLEDDISKLRPTRLLSSDGVVRPYNLIEAEGNRILLELEKGKFAKTDNYIEHYKTSKDEVLLFTDKRIAYISHSDVFGGWQVDWAYAWSELPSGATIHPKGIQIPIPEGKKKRMGLFGSNVPSRLILIQNDSIKEKIVKTVENMRANANA